MVASSQPLATAAGLEQLRRGGSAADAAIAAAAALAVTQPCSTGLGGDAFCLYYEAATGRKHFFLVDGSSYHNIYSVGQAQYRSALAALFGLRDAVRVVQR